MGGPTGENQDRTINVGYVHIGATVYSGPEYGDVWECADNCPHPDHLTEDEHFGSNVSDNSNNKDDD